MNDPASPASRQSPWILLATILGSAVVFLDGTVVNIALPRIGRELPSHLLGTLEGQTYVYNSYLLALSSLLLLAGAISDQLGRRRTFIWGLVGFGLTSLLCGIAPNIESLILFRFLQGMAGAVLVPGSLALLRDHFTGEAQGRAFGRWASGTSVAILLGPFVGGVLVDSLSWRWVFLINLPVIAAAIVAAVRSIPADHPQPRESRSGLDWLNAGISIVAIGGITLSLIYGQQRAWASSLAWLLLAVGLAAAAILPWSLRVSPHQLIPIFLFRSRNFVAVNLGTLVIYGALYVNGYYMPLFLQGVLGYTAAAAGIITLPSSLFVIFLSPRMGALAARIGPRLLLTLGPSCMAVALLLLARVPVGSQAWHLSLSRAGTLMPPASYFIDIFPATLLFGLGISMLVAPLTSTLMSSAPGSYGGVASAFNNAISRVGPQLAGSLVFVATSAVFYASLGSHPAGISPLNRPSDAHLLASAGSASTTAFHVAMLICAALLGIGAAIGMWGLEHGRAVQVKEPHLP